MGAALVPVLLALFVLHRLMPKPLQPYGRLGRAFAAGTFAIVPALVVSLLVGESSVGDNVVAAFARQFVLTGLIEETSKFMGLVLLAWPPAYTGRPSAAAILGAFAGVGFAAAEILLIAESPSILRGITAVPFHALATSSLIAFFSAHRNLPQKTLACVAATALVHTLYNYAAMELPPFLAIGPALLTIWAVALIRLLRRSDVRYLGRTPNKTRSTSIR